MVCPSMPLSKWLHLFWETRFTLGINEAIQRGKVVICFYTQIFKILVSYIKLLILNWNSNTVVKYYILNQGHCWSKALYWLLCSYLAETLYRRESLLQLLVSEDIVHHGGDGMPERLPGGHCGQVPYSMARPYSREINAKAQATVSKGSHASYPC